MEGEITRRSWNVVVVGAGPAGLMAALTARKEGAEVLLLEKMDEPGKKLILTGHGRCNMTNLRAAEDLTVSYYKNGRFLSSAFAALPPEKVREFFDGLGLPSHEEDDGRIFPDTQKALTVRDTLVSALETSGVVIRTGAAVTSIRRTEEAQAPWRVVTSGGTFSTEKVILATGGKSFPQTGSEGDGYVLAKMAGHEITELTPALAPVFLKSFLSSEDMTRCDACGAEFTLAGLSLNDIAVTLRVQGKKVITERGDLLFTHQGVSGPAVMKLSRNLPNDPELYAADQVVLEMNFLPDKKEEEVQELLLSEMTKNPNRHMRRLLCETFHIPEKIAELLPGLDLAANQVTREMRRKMVNGLCASAFTVAKSTPMEIAYVTCGGVKLKGIAPKTMESKLAPGLFIGGELLDIDGISGGYNLQCAWATGYAAGMAAAGK